MNSIKKNISLLFIVQISNYVFPLLTLPYLARKLGIEQFGILALSQSIIQYCILLTDYGFNLSATRRISLAESNTLASKAFLSVFYTKCIFVIICFVVLLVFTNFISVVNDKKLLISVLYLSVIGNLLFPLYLFQGLERMKDIVWITLIAKCVSLISVFLLVHDENDTLGAAFSLSLGMLVSGLLASAYILRKKIILFSRVSLYDLIFTIKDGFPFFISNIAISFYTTLNVIVVGNYFSAPTVGGYSAAERIRMAGQSLYSPIQQVIYPRVNVLYKNNDGYFNSIKKYALIFVTFGFLITLFVYLFGYKLALWYLGSQYELGAQLFVSMAPLFVIVSLSIVLGQWGLIVIGEARKLSYIYCICAIVHVLYLYPYIKSFGVFGVVYSIISTELIVCLLMSGCLLNRLRRKLR